MVLRVTGLLAAMVCSLVVWAPAALGAKSVGAVLPTNGPAGAVGVSALTGDLYLQIRGEDRIERLAADGSSFGSFGVSGAGDGQFAFGSSTPQIAIDGSDGSVWVADPGNNRVQKLSAAGVFELKVGRPDGAAGSGDGELSGPTGVAIDPVSGDVYVADTGNNRVQRFSSAGAFEAVIGAGELTGPSHVAVDPTGRVYVLDAGAARVVRYTDTGIFDVVIGEGQIQLPFSLAVSPVDGHLFVTAFDAAFTLAIYEFDETDAIVDAHGQPPVQEIAGLAFGAETTPCTPRMDSSRG